MASKPRSEWSPAYAARIARAEAAGKSRQAARGHSSGEHIIRRERKAGKPMAEAKAAAASRKAAPPKAPPKKPWKITSADKAYARRWGKALSWRGGTDPTKAAQMAVDYMVRVGREKFRLQVQHQRDAMARGPGETGMGQLQAWHDDDGFPDISWYFYK